MAFDQVEQVMPPFFLVRIPKKEQRERLEKIGLLYYPPEHVYMKRGMQCGEIMMIGSAAHEFFPEAKVGHILIAHHMIEGKVIGNKQKFFLLQEDEDWNYYCVTAFCYNGDRNNTFGVWDGEKIIPSKDYVFFDIDPTPVSDLPEFILEQKGMPRIITNIPMEKAEGGLVVPKARKKTRQELIQKMAENKAEIQKWAKWIPITPQKVNPLIHDLETQNYNISKKVNKREYEPHVLHSFNDELLKTVHPLLRKGDKVFVLNIAAYMQVEFMGIEYIISESKYVVAKAPSRELVS